MRFPFIKSRLSKKKKKTHASLQTKWQQNYYSNNLYTGYGMCKHLTQNTKKTCSRKRLLEYKVPKIAGDVEIAACLCVPRMWDIEAGIANGTVMHTDQAAHRLRAVTLFWNERTSNIFCKCDDIITFDNTQGHAVVASALLLRALIAQQPTLQVRSPEYTPTSPPSPTTLLHLRSFNVVAQCVMQMM